MATDEKILAYADIGYDGSLDLFQIPATNSGITDVKYVTHKPKNQFSTEGNIKFYIPGAGQWYVDLREMYIKTIVRIVKADGSLVPEPPVRGPRRKRAQPEEPGTSHSSSTDDTASNRKSNDEGSWSCGPCNHLAHSLFSQVDLRLNDTVVIGGQSSYSYLSLINTLLGESCRTESELECSMFIKDTAGFMDDLSLSLGANEGFVERAKLMQGSQYVELWAKLDLGVLKQKKYLVNGINMDLTLTPTSNSFRLMTSNSDETDYVIDMKDISLVVKQVLPANPILVAHQDIMQNKLSMAKYFYIDEQLRKFSLPKSTSSFYVEDAFCGKIPQHITLAFVSSEALSGSLHRNPYNFKTYGCNYIAVTVNGVPGPRGVLSFDFEKDQYVDQYSELYKDKPNIPDRSRIKLHEFSQGYALFVINLAPENKDGTYYPAIRSGNLRLEITFSESLPESVVMLARVTYPGLFSVDHARNIYLT